MQNRVMALMREGGCCRFEPGSGTQGHVAALLEAIQQ